jgi:oxygen-dependent protoporphyrinogen oxidase
VLTNVVTDELKDVMGIKAQPDFAKVYTHVKGIPQYSPGHERRLEKVDEIVGRFHGLYITGNAYRGIGVNDCVGNSYKLAEKIINDI